VLDVNGATERERGSLGIMVPEGRLADPLQYVFVYHTENQSMDSEDALEELFEAHCRNCEKMYEEDVNKMIMKYLWATIIMDNFTIST